MKRNPTIQILSALLLIFAPLTAHAEELPDQPYLVISEIKIKNDPSGYNEYLEISNIGNEPLTMNEYSLDYFNTHTPTVTQAPIRATVGTGVLLAGQSIVLARDKTQIVNAETLPLSSLSDSAGLIRLVKGEEIIDSIAWSSTASLAVDQIVHMPSTATAKSLSRTVTTSEEDIITMMWNLVIPNPLAYELVPLPEEAPKDEDLDEIELPSVELPAPEEETPIESTDSDLPPETETEAAAPAALPEETSILLPLQITELLPNPGAPQSDAEDEYVEIYNPNAEPIELDGFKLQTGNTYAYSYVFENVEAPALGFITVTSGASNISLANTVGKARLLDASGIVVSEAPEYTDGPEGLTWALIEGAWQWTTAATPGAVNILSVPAPPENKQVAAQAKAPKATKTTKAKAPAKTATPKAASKTTPKVASAKVTSTAKSKAKKNDEPAVAAAVDSKQPPAPLHPIILYSIGALAVGYAVYEYRYDISNRWYWLRRYIATRRLMSTQASED